MIATHRSEPAPPDERGAAFGEQHRDRIRENVDFYGRLFGAAGIESTLVADFGKQTLSRVADWAPDLATELTALAAGANCDDHEIAALNARTEVLALAARPQRGECSTVVKLPRIDNGDGAEAAQTWDWHDEIADGWLVWSIELEGGARLHTLTEFGILGKIGISSAGIAVLLNILHHTADGYGSGIPVHLLARRILDRARDINDAVVTLSAAPVSASSALTLVAAADGDTTALTAEVHPDGPDFVLPENELLAHTNHFLAPRAAVGDREPLVGPDSFFRLELLRRRLDSAKNTKGELVAALASHLGGAGALCCHPDESAAIGLRYRTLATVSFDMEHLAMTVTGGGPCERSTGDSVTVYAAKEGAPLA